MISVDVRVLAREKSGELQARPPIDRWAACASIWSRLFVLSGPGWMKWPGLAEKMRGAFSLAMQRSIGVDISLLGSATLAAFESFDIEDDGPSEWGYMIDMIEIISPVISGVDVNGCLETGLRVYLQAMFNNLARSYAIEAGRPVSIAEVWNRLASDAEWMRVVSFAESLLLVC